jgi:hypothetical protein
MVHTYGEPILFGIPETQKPLLGFPEGRIRLRFREKTAVKAFIRNASGIRVFLIQDNGDHWAPSFEWGRNLTITPE